MSMVGELRHYGRTLDLGADPYRLDEAFYPPATALQPYLAGGASANKYDGSIKVGERADDVRFTIPIQVRGSSNAEIRTAASRLANFLELTNDPRDDLEFAYRPFAAILKEPIFGQFDASQRFVITHFHGLSPDKSYGVGTRRDSFVVYEARVLLRPVSTGARQRLGLAKQGVNDDYVAKSNGRIRGVNVMPGITNLFTNPAFSHATYNNGWTADAGIRIYNAVDPGDFLFGNGGVRLYAQALDLDFYQSVNAGTTSTIAISFYARRVDGEAVTASDVTVFYNTAKTPTDILYVGNGWYRVEWVGAGVNAAQNTGIRCETRNREFYIDGFQLEVGPWPTPFCFGDDLGCSWSGTAHASSSSRSHGSLIYDPSIIDPAQGTIRFVVQAHVDSSDITPAKTLLHVTGGVLATLYYSTPQLLFNNGVIVNGDFSFSKGDIIIVHGVWGAAPALYGNGALLDSTTLATTAMHTLTNVYIGDSATPGTPFPGTIIDCSIWDDPMTTAEVLADYNNIANALDPSAPELIDALSPLPWLWTPGGAGVLENTLSASYDNYCWIGGIPGDLPAKFDFVGDFSGNTENFDSLKRLYMSRFDLSKWHDPFNLFSEVQGTVLAGSSGGEYDSVAVTTSGVLYPQLITLENMAEDLMGKSFILLARLRENGTLEDNIGVAAGFVYGESFYNEPRYNSTYDFVYRIVRSNAMSLPADMRIQDGRKSYPWFQLRLVRASGGGQAVGLDYFDIFMRPFAEFVLPNAAVDHLFYDGKKATSLTGSNLIAWPIPIYGDQITMMPNKYNFVKIKIGDDSVTGDIDWEMDFAEAHITPRWRVL